MLSVKLFSNINILVELAPMGVMTAIHFALDGLFDDENIWQGQLITLLQNNKQVHY